MGNDISDMKYTKDNEKKVAKILNSDKEYKKIAKKRRKLKKQDKYWKVRERNEKRNS